MDTEKIKISVKNNFNQNSTHNTRNSKEIKNERLNRAKERVRSLEKIQEVSLNCKVFLGLACSAALFVFTYFFISIYIFPQIDFTLKILYTSLFAGIIGYGITVILVIIGTFFESRDYSLLTLLCPPIALLGILSKKIRKLVSFYLLFNIMYLVLTLASILAICITQNLTLEQLGTFLQSNLDSSNFKLDEISKYIIKIFKYLFKVDDPKYK